MQLPCPAYEVSPEDLKRNPPAINAKHVVQFGVATSFQALLWEAVQNQHSVLQNVSIQLQISSTLGQSGIVGVRLGLSDIYGNEVADVFIARDFNSQRIIGDTGLVAGANAGFIAAYALNVPVPIIVPAGHDLLLYSYGWTSNGLPPALHNYSAGLTSFSYPMGNIVR
jgi:hypothetical protein